MQDFMEIKKLLIRLICEVEDIKEAFIQLPEWFPVTDIAKDKGLSRQTVLAKLHNGEFEPEVDFKYIGHKIYIARGAVSRITRKRR